MRTSPFSAGSAFPSEGFPFTVHSVFPRAVNLRADSGRYLLSLVAHPTQAHPRAALIADARFASWGWLVGGRGTFDGSVLRWGEEFSTWLGGERRHPAEERVNVAATAVPVARRRQCLHEAASAIASLRTKKSVGESPSLKGWFATVKARSASEFLAACRRLVGCGQGLTPAGDDVLCGALAGLRAQALSDPSLEAFLDEVGEAALHPSHDLMTRTTDVSAAFLAEAWKGRFSAALVNFGEAALGLTDTLNEAVAVLGALGHSSGTDAALGFLQASGG